MYFGIFCFLLKFFFTLLCDFEFCLEVSLLTMSSQDKIKKGQRKSIFCGHFMSDWDDHHFCPKCRNDLKSDNSCVCSAVSCSVC